MFIVFPWFQSHLNYIRTVLNSCKIHRTYFLGEYMFISEPLPFVERLFEKIDIKDKASGGYVMEQKCVFIVLIAKTRSSIFFITY